MLPSKYNPQNPEEFIGADGAAAVAGAIRRIVTMAMANENAPIKLLLPGPPGTGKSALALYLQRLLGCNKFSTMKLNGTQVRIETVEQMASQMHYRSLFGDYRMIWIDEADEIPRVAQVRFLTLLDDLPAGVAVICTSNSSMRNFEDRFQSRFQAFDVKAPTTQEIEWLLRKWVDGPTAAAIAQSARGNVRQALLDAQGVVQMAA